MTGINEKLIPLTFLNQHYFDKDSGELLASGTLEFYKDDSRATPKTVYQIESSGGDYTYTALPNPITLNASGAPQDASGNNVVIYAYPYEGTPAQDKNELDLYYIICKNSAGTTQWTRQAVPNLNEDNDPIDEAASLTNQIANPQFTRYFLKDSATTLTVSSSNQVFPIAPDWDIVASGSGSVVITRTSVAGSDNIATKPAYYLRIQTGTGVTSCSLRQRLEKNSGIWSGGYVGAFFVARLNAGANDGLTFKYKDSSGSLTDETIFDANLDANWTAYSGAALLDDSNNASSGSDAYVDLEILLPNEGTIDITSIMAFGSNSQIQEDLINYQKRSANREQTMMGDYFIPALENKKIESLLIGWDFPLNPTQFGSSGTISSDASTGKGAYIWDQTIAGRAGSNFTYARNSTTNGLQVTSSSTDSSFYILQYLSTKEVKRLLGNKLSVNVNAWKTSAGDDVTMRVYLYRAAAATAFPTLSNIIGTLAAGTGVFTNTSSFVEIPRSNLPTAQATLTSIADSAGINDSNVNYHFNQWEITSASQIDDTDKFAIVVTFQVPSTSTVVTINSVSLCLGDIATQPAAKSFESVLRECQYYYEKSYDSSVAVGTASFNNALSKWQLVTPRDQASTTKTRTTRAAHFEIDYKVQKFQAPTITLRTPNTGAATNKVYGKLYNAGSLVGGASGDITFGDFWSTGNINTKTASYVRKNNTTMGSTSAIDDGLEFFIQFHYIADARIAK